MNTLESTIVTAARRELLRLNAPAQSVEDREDALAAFRSLSTLCSLAHIAGSGMGEAARLELVAMEKEAANALKSLSRDEVLPSIPQLLGAFDVSGWLKTALASAAQRDPVDAARDAELLHLVLAARVEEVAYGRHPATSAPGRDGRAAL